MNTDHFRQLLLDQRQALETAIDQASDSTRPVELDQTVQGRLSRMDAIQQQQMSLASERRRKEQLQRIESALKRIESGDFGYCVKCDEEIAAKRLELDPTTLTCINCAAG